MSTGKQYDPAYRDWVLDTRRREIHAARLKIILDDKLGRVTSPEVKRLAEMESPSVRRPFNRNYLNLGDQADERRSHRDQVLDTLRREIYAARLKIILDEQLGRETSPEVRRLAGMKAPSSRRWRKYTLRDRAASATDEKRVVHETGQ